METAVTKYDNIVAVKRISCVGFLARNSYEINNSQVGGISTLTNKCIGEFLSQYF